MNLRITEAARAAGVNKETLRYYERRGLLEEPVRSPGGHRLYGDHAVQTLRTRLLERNFSMIDFAHSQPLRDRESIEGWAELFALLADRTRLRILFPNFQQFHRRPE